MSNDTWLETPSWRVFTTVVLLAIAVLVAGDIVDDLRTGAVFRHVVVEAVIAMLALFGLAVLWGQTLAVRRRARSLASDLSRVTAEAAHWRQEAESHLKGLSEAIDRQFERWALTPAEREIGLLLLKGLSLKEIADVRTTSERTVRQQTLAIYRKAGLAGRAELAAFFLEDLLLPTSAGASRASS